jgi:hypothetical protein
MQTAREAPGAACQSRAPDTRAAAFIAHSPCFRGGAGAFERDGHPLGVNGLLAVRSVGATADMGGHVNKKLFSYRQFFGIIFYLDEAMLLIFRRDNDDFPKTSGFPKQRLCNVLNGLA